MTIALIAVTPLSAQLTMGMSGLMSQPSAEMNPDKTLMIGGNFLNDRITSDRFPYNTFNYFLSATFLPFLEVSYTATLFRGISLQNKVPPEKYNHFVNQDRSFSMKIRVLKESKYIPAFAVGINDIYSQSGGGTLASESGNQYFSRFYGVLSKNFAIHTERVGVHVSYLYNRRRDNTLNNFGLGATYHPSYVPNLRLVGETDLKSLYLGANYHLFNRVYFQALVQNFKYFSCGLAVTIHPKGK